MREVNKITEIAKKYTLKNDAMFKEFFSRKSNEKFLKSFLSAVLNSNVTKIEVQKDSSLSIEGINNKQGILDIKATIDDEKIVDIEMQLRKYSNVPNRTNFYASKLVASQLKKGEDYGNIKPVIIILILNYNMFSYEDYITESITVSKEHKDVEIDNLQKIIVIELKKIKGKNMRSDLLDWLVFIEGEDERRIGEIMERNAMIKEAAEELERLMENEEAVALVEAKEKALRDERAFINYATETGLKRGLKKGKKIGQRIGIEKGIEKERNEIIRKMLKNGLDIQTICKYIGLTKEEVIKLKN